MVPDETDRMTTRPSVRRGEAQLAAWVEAKATADEAQDGGDAQARSEQEEARLVADRLCTIGPRTTLEAS